MMYNCGETLPRPAQGERRSPCPAPEDVVGFTLGILDPSRRAVVAVHIASCPECDAEASTLRELLESSLEAEAGDY